MTQPHHVPDQPQETVLSLSTPSIEWMPLDGLIQSWADFAHETTCAAGLFAASAAFAALACECAALSSYLEAENRRNRDVLSWLPRIQADRVEALTQLSTACQHWLSVEPWLSRCSVAHDFANGVIPDLVHSLGVHELYLFRLFMRALEETATESGEPLRILVAHLRAADLEVGP
jgi:hypothetical protein